ncbi:MAG: hypothetical protein FRX49_01681 [Trebouxia sp. A1-2]|nr:MAG: hypothetical protein FRX49_01681 [Trebouxia sp. A1-2]
MPFSHENHEEGGRTLLRLWLAGRAQDTTRQCEEPGIMAEHGHSDKAPDTQWVEVQCSALSKSCPAKADGVVERNVGEAHSKNVAARVFCKWTSARDESMNGALSLQPDAHSHCNCLCKIVCKPDPKPTTNSYCQGLQERSKQ